MDPEDLREVISAYQKCVAETVGRFSGFVAKYMGDGVLVYFGYPQAHEDDAERAVRAGLELVAAAGALQTGAPLQSRVSRCSPFSRTPRKLKRILSARSKSHANNKPNPGNSAHTGWIITFG